MKVVYYSSFRFFDKLVDEDISVTIMFTEASNNFHLQSKHYQYSNELYMISINIYIYQILMWIL